MINSSIANIDQFIQAQKEKLRKDRNSNTPNRLSETRNNDYINSSSNLSPRAAIKQAHPSPSIYVPLEEQMPVQAHRITRVYPEKENMNESFFDKFGKYEQKKQKLKRDLQEEFSKHQKFNKRDPNGRQVYSEVSKEFYATLPLGQNNRFEKQKQQEVPRITENRNKGFTDESYNAYKSSSNLPINEVPRYENIDPYRAYSAGYSNDNYPRQTSSHSLNAPPSSINNQLGYQQTSYPRNDKFQLLDALDSKINQIPLSSNGIIQSYGNETNLDPSLGEILRRPPVYMTLNNTKPRPSENVQFDEPLIYRRSPPVNIQQNYSRPSIEYDNRAYVQQDSSRPLEIIRKIQTESDVFNTQNGTKEEKYRDKSQKTREYQEELQRQIREKQLQKQKDKEIEEKMDKKILNEVNNFSPFGRGGGGAPLKDREGNPIGDLSKLKSEAKELNNLPIEVQRQVKMQQLENEVRYQGDLTQRKQNVDGELPNYARGGNGIFGEAKTEVQKKNEEKYKAELKRQIEEKKEREAREKEKLRLEEEKEMKRIEEQQRKMKEELEEEERKKREKEQTKTPKDDPNLLVVQKRKEAQKGRKFENKKNDIPVEIVSKEDPKPYIEFRSNSPPIPAIQKKLDENPKNNIKKNSEIKDRPEDGPEPAFKKKTLRIDIDNEEPSVPVPEYFVTESRLDNKETIRDDRDLQKPMATYRKNYPSIVDKDNTRNISRPPSVKSYGSSTEVLKQLHSLKKHLHNEQMLVENELNNTVTVGQVVDRQQKLLRVRTPDDPFSTAVKNEPVRVKRETSDMKSRLQKKIFDDAPYTGGNEPKTYFREGSVTLKDYEDSNFESVQKKQSDNNLDFFDRPMYPNYDVGQISTRNEQRLRKLRDLEGDNLSIDDPNEVLNKFLNRNKRRPSVTTLQDDTWEKNQY